MAGGREARGLGLVAGGSSPLACKYHAYLYALGDYYNNHMLQAYQCLLARATRCQQQ